MLNDPSNHACLLSRGVILLFKVIKPTFSPGSEKGKIL